MAALAPRGGTTQPVPTMRTVGLTLRQPLPGTAPSVLHLGRNDPDEAGTPRRPRTIYLKKLDNGIRQRLAHTLEVSPLVKPHHVHYRK